MNTNPLLVKLGRALLTALLCAATGSAFATPTFGTRVNTYCARQPVQAVAPQQSRPYQASGSSCLLCHTSANATANNLNAFGTASISCTGTGTATNCGSAVNQFCLATAPSGAAITAPPAGTTVAQGQSLTYTAANATNPDGFPLAYNWLFSGGMPSVTGQSVAVPMTTVGAITSTLQVRNSVGMLATGATPSVAVTVTAPANQAPAAVIGAPAANVSLVQGGSVTFAGSGTDPDNNLPLTYSWTFGGGTPASSTAQNPGAVTFNSVGTFTATFLVRDSLGLASAPVSRTITVSPAANQPPVATINAPAANVTVTQGGTVNFMGSGTDPNNNLPLTYSWNFGGGAPNSTLQNPGAVTFNTAGTFTVTFTVTDSLGLASTPVTRTVTVTTGTGQPVATILAPAINVSILPNGSVNFRSLVLNPANPPLSYRWTFQGGSPATSRQQNPGAVRFSSPGPHTATLTVTDSRGNVLAPVTRLVTVAPANRIVRAGNDCRDDDDDDDDDGNGNGNGSDDDDD